MSTVGGNDATDGPLAADIDPPANVLLLVPSMGTDGDAVCHQLLLPVSPEEVEVLYVSLTRSPDDRLESWRTHIGGSLPANTGIISVGEGARSAAGAAGTVTGPFSGPVRVESVSSPSDLTGLGIGMSEILEDWATSDHQSVVCFDSLTTLLQYADLQRVFRFLHVATARCESVDALAHFHLDPGAHDEKTLNTLLSLFDTLIEYEDGAWTVRNR